MKQRQTSRRLFMKNLTAMAAASGLPAWFLEQSLGAAEPAKPTGDNDKPWIALIGCGGRGRGIGKEAAVFGKMVALCDVDSKNLGQSLQMFPGAMLYKDFRQVIDRDDIDIIINGTPDHWHTFLNLAAVKSGKDVYSEKPLTFTIDEGKRLVAAVKRSKRILQTGSQQRSDSRFRLACELVRNGRIGKLSHIDTILPAGRRGGPFQTAPIPPELDWDLWQGQTPTIEYVPERCHSNFRYWYDYSGGTMTDWGAHHNDIALWGLGMDTSGPTTIEGRPLVEMIPGGYTAASEYKVDYVYANGVTHTCQSTTADNPSGGVVNKEGLHHGVKFTGSDGWIFVTRGKIEASKPEMLSEPLTQKSVELYVSSNHMGNFFDCVQSRKAPVCDAEIGHRSVSLCHLGVIAIRLGRKLEWDPAREVFLKDKEANSYVSRPQRKPYTYNFA